MNFSLRSFGLFFVWVAIVIGLMCQIRFEMISQHWPSGVPSDLIWILNLLFALVVVLVSIATRAKNKMFWVGCAVIAVALFVCQATGQRPRAVARYISFFLIELMVDTKQVVDPLKESHLTEIGAVWTYSLIPLLSLAGGAFTQWIYERSEKHD